MIAVFLGVGEEVEVDVNHVFLRPHGSAPTLARIFVVFGGEDERNFVFVEVVLVVRSQAEEEAHLAVAQVLVAGQCVGVDEELKMLVAA